MRVILVLDVVSSQEGVDLAAGVGRSLGLDVVVLLLGLRDAVDLGGGRLEAVLLQLLGLRVLLVVGLEPVGAELALLEFELLGEQLLAVDELQFVLLLLVDLLRGGRGLGLLRLGAVEGALLLELVQADKLGLLLVGRVVDVRLDAVAQLEVVLALRELLVEGGVVLAGLRVVHQLGLVDRVVGDLLLGGGGDGLGGGWVDFVIRLELLELGVKVQGLASSSEEGVALGRGEEAAASGGGFWAVGRWRRLSLQGVLLGNSVHWFRGDVHGNGLGWLVVDRVRGGANDLDAGALSHGLGLLEWTGSWATALSDLDLLLGFFLVVVLVVVIVLEDGGSRARSGRGRARRNRTRSQRSAWVVLGNVLVGIFLGLLFLLIVAFRVVGVARVSGHIGELTFVTVRVDVSVLSAHNAIGSAGFLLERSIGGFISESERTIIVNLVVVANGLYWRSARFRNLLAGVRDRSRGGHLGSVRIGTSPRSRSSILTVVLILAGYQNQLPRILLFGTGLSAVVLDPLLGRSIVLDTVQLGAVLLLLLLNYPWAHSKTALLLGLGGAGQ